MRMHDGADIGSHSIAGQGHRDLGSALFPALDLIALHVHDKKVVDMHHTLANAGGSSQDAVLIQPYRDVAVVGSHPSFLVYQAADIDDVLPIFLLRLIHRNLRMYHVARRSPA